MFWTSLPSDLSARQYGLSKILENLRDIGNTVLVVEHDEEMMRSADHILDIGLYAGELGGNLVFEGDFLSLIQTECR
jgi:excinuclease ABC subunit A